ncbi:Peroxisomal multifunctional enzyme type 2 [Lecanosticta acicola]|uniref:Peroxisomal multifunctional enzyme type 2 n=1 Tax=Lecanosticta acicola TaxID=111012 RepID=A0AAI8Z3F4_9PEZI|nr:Peroxisomal multifunctional enzyme type 2 [Lecanosticta acicola]
MAQNNPGAGHQNKPVEVSWLKRDVLLFAASIGATADELHYLYELHPNFAVFPTYPVILPFKKASQEVVDFYAAQDAARPQIPGAPKLDNKNVLDGERKMEFFKPLPTTSVGRKFETREKIVGLYDKGKPGSVLETQVDLVDAQSGEVYVRITGSAFFIGQGNWGGPKGPKTESFPPPEGKRPDMTYENPTTAETTALYRLNGDYNPLHIDPQPGKAMGFGGVIIHGLYSWNNTAHALVKLLGGGDPASIKEYAARFASPVKPGDTLVTEMWRMGKKDGEGWEEVRFQVKIKGGKVCLSNGRAKMKVQLGVKSGSKL